MAAAGENKDMVGVMVVPDYFSSSRMNSNDSSTEVPASRSTHLLQQLLAAPGPVQVAATEKDASIFAASRTKDRERWLRKLEKLERRWRSVVSEWVAAGSASHSTIPEAAKKLVRDMPIPPTMRGTVWTLALGETSYACSSLC
jgi:hypothetical protein